MIRLAGVGLRLGEFTLRDITLDVPEGGYGLVIGPSGSGKTTLLEAVAGLAPVSTGSITVRGQEVTYLPPERRGLGMVYQRYHLFPHFTVGQNIGYGLDRHRMSVSERRARVREVADALAIADLLERGVRRLSGGEAQRVALARALAPRPSILLLDEPFASLDPSTREGIRRELERIHEQEGITILHVTHDFDEALRLGDVVAVMALGEIVQQGRPEEVFRHPNSPFVARFIGAANVLPGQVTRTGPAGERAGTFAARFTSSDLVLDTIAEREGQAHAVVQPEDIALSHTPQASSARNQFRGEVVAVERMGPLTYVHIEAGRRLVAALTTASVDGMGIAPGSQVFATIKATAIHLM